MITARALTRRFGAVVALAGVDLDVARGELFALIGPDGAGKTTFFRIVAGLLAPSGGSLRVDKGGTLGMVPQRFSLYEDLSVDENLLLRSRMYAIPDAEAKARAASLLSNVGLSGVGGRTAGTLSGGMKQKLSLVAALLTRPDLLLLDEPTTGVDPVSRREFWLLLSQLHAEGLTILVSTPYMDEAEYATRIGFLDHGRLAAVGTRHEILASYTRPLVEIRTDDRLAVRARLTRLPFVDDVSLFGTRLHARGTDDAGDFFEREIRKGLEGLVPDGDIRRTSPSLEDVFVLRSEDA
ncbi:MAG TPA: ABC transporter ATP-binding protein [Thermoanaerobaculia bacterium]|nr:ABC transporter ATP-binding protein [Thermoanaerobaculia bacterium]